MLSISQHGRFFIGIIIYMTQSSQNKRTRVIILGGGFAGLTAAKTLDEHLNIGNDANLEVTLIDRGGSKYIGATNQFVLAGRKQREAVCNNFTPDSVKLNNVNIVVDEVTQLALAHKKVITQTNVYEFDCLIVSLGIDYYPELVPGLKDAGYNLCSMDDVIKFRQELAEFNGGTVIVGVSGLPYKCPPVVHEMSYVVHDLLVEHGVRDKTALIFTTPFKAAVPVVNPVVMQGMMDECDIKCHYEWNMQSIDSASKTIHYDEGKRLHYDLLLCTYPQKGATLLLETPDLCNDDGWIPVNGRDHRTTFEGVYAIGDNCANKVTFSGGRVEPHPKAGGFALVQGEYVAQVIIHDALHPESAEWTSPPFEMSKGNGCIIEGHGGRGVMFEVNFFDNPDKPSFQVIEPKEGLVEEKMAWVDSHRHTWFNDSD